MSALDDQAARWAALDPLLPIPAAPAGEVRTGAGWAAVLQPRTPGPDDPELLSAADASLEVTAVLGADPAPGLRALLPLALAEAAEVPGRATVLSWPSRDVAATRVLLDHGFAPLSVVAVAARPTGRPDGAVRTAGPDDLATVLALVLAERAYSVSTGPAVARPGDAALLEAELAARLGGAGTVWLAERAGRAVGVLDGGLVYAAPGSWLAGRLPLGVWGAVHHCGVLDADRGGGVGRRLVEHAHAAWSAAQGVVLHYHPANPLSSVFWPRRGYRPLWTVWEHRPPPRG
ncbi:GNAT family N-acetyltransferase [Rhodococcus aerolatus]